MIPRPSTGVRERVIAAAQRAFHERGYHGTSLDEILDRAGTTKGGLYHHFEDKRALARAVIQERLAELVRARWGSTDWHDDPIHHLQQAVRTMNPAHLRTGCPVNTLAQEVAFDDDRLRQDLEAVFDLWIAALEAGLRAGIERGTVRADVDARAAATYFLAVWEGFVALAKTKEDGEAFVDAAIGPLIDWLDGLRSVAT